MATLKEIYEALGYTVIEGLEGAVSVASLTPNPKPFKIVVEVMPVRMDYRSDKGNEAVVTLKVLGNPMTYIEHSPFGMTYREIDWEDEFEMPVSKIQPVKEDESEL